MLAAGPIDAAIASPLAALTPEGAALVFFAALAIDTWALGGPKLAPWFDRVAFIGWVSVWAAGFQGSGLTGMIDGSLTGLFGILAGLWDAPLFRGFMHIGPQIVGFLAFLVAVGCFVPSRVKFLGAFGRLEFAHLKQFGKSVMVQSGVSRTTATATGAAPGNSPWKRIFPGQVNVGMVVVALLVVTFSTIIQGGVGTLMQLAVGECLVLSSDAVAPILRSMGFA